MWRYTGYAQDRGGKTLALNQHNLQCGAGYMMSGILLQRFHDNIRFRFRCCKTVGLSCTMRRRTNAFSYSGNWNLIFLDRQTVQCDPRAVQPINSLRMITSGHQLTYQYDCCHSSAPVRCYWKYTPFNSDGHGNAIFLDRHNVQCNSHRDFLTHLHLTRSPPHRFRYNYKCCSMSG